MSTLWEIGFQVTRKVQIDGQVTTQRVCETRYKHFSCVKCLVPLQLASSAGRDPCDGGKSAQGTAAADQAQRGMQHGMRGSN